MAVKIISILFLSRNLAHKEHLSTSSFAQHMALGEFYDNIVCLADKLAETWQGRHGIIKDYPVMKLSGGKNIADKLEKLMGMVETERYGGDYGDVDTSIQNIIDEIVGQYLRTLYKLRTLK